MQLEKFVLLSGESFNIEGIGEIKQPTLLDIQHFGFSRYEDICRYLLVDLFNFLELTKLTNQYNALSEEGKKVNTLFNLMMASNEFREVYKEIFSFFIGKDVTFDEDLNGFLIWEDFILKESTFKKIIKKIFKSVSSTPLKEVCGFICDDNFNDIRDCLLQINNLKPQQQDNQLVKYKNEMARKLAERMAKASEKREAQKKDILSLDKMISKFCADNKNGINILNVWEMTIYQFYDQFSQHNYMRQVDIQDMVYTNTVTFSDIKAYDSQLWLK